MLQVYSESQAFLPWPGDKWFSGQLETALLSITIGQYDVIWLSLTRWNHVPIPFEDYEFISLQNQDLQMKAALTHFLDVLLLHVKSNCEHLNKLYKFYIGLLLAQNTRSKLACANYANPAFTAVTGGTFIAMNKSTFAP